MYADKFVEYLQNEEKKAANTAEAYGRDIARFELYLSERGTAPENVTDTDIASYLFMLKKEGKSSSTMNRKLASIRAYYAFLTDTGVISKGPALKLAVPKAEKRELEYLTYEEVVTLLEAPDDSPSGIRDRAMLEVMYATGMRVSEVIEAKVSDCNTLMGFMTFDGTHGRARIVPMGGPARKAMSSYLDNVRSSMLKDKEDHGYLFVNYMGNPMTRQGLWKILKNYGKKVGLEDRMTTHILRASFAVHMVQNGADIKSLQELMGHEDISATEVYMSIRKTKIKEVYDKTHPRA